MSKNLIPTVTGQTKINSLGRTLVHEHIALGYPGWSADKSVAPFDFSRAHDRAVKICKRLKSEHGVDTVIDVTPNDLGRIPALLQAVAERTSLNIICATGLYFEYRGADTYFKSRMAWSDITSEIAELFRMEVTDGIHDTGIRAGVIKVGTSLDEVTEYERCVLQAAGRVSSETGVPVVTHTEQSTMGLEQVDILTDAGASPKQILIGHAGGSDIEYYTRILETGAHLGFDQFGMERSLTDDDRIEMLIQLSDAGYASQLHMSHDYVINFLGRDFSGLRDYFPSHSPWTIFEDSLSKLSSGGSVNNPAEQYLNQNVRSLFHN